MRVLFVCLSERSHLYCLTPLAWAMVAAGHEVRVASSPRLTSTITKTGLTALPVGPDHAIYQGMSDYRESQDFASSNWSCCEPGEIDLAQMRERYELSVPWAFAVYNDSMIDDLVQTARNWKPDLVVRDPLAYAGGLAARVSGAMHVRLMWCADVWGRSHQTFLKLMADLPEAERIDPLSDWLNERGREYGISCDDELLHGHATLTSMPASLGTLSASPEIPVRHVPHNGEAVVWDWLREDPDRTRICLSLGTSNTEDYGGDYVSVPQILQALAGEDIEVVAALLPAQREALGPVPDNVRVVDSVALHTLLPSCSAIIHHGGYGTFATAMVYGVPQLILSTSVSDHLLRGRALQEAGAGFLVHHAEADPEQVRTLIRRMLDEPRFALAADRLRLESAAMPSPHDVVAQLEQLMATR